MFSRANAFCFVVIMHKKPSICSFNTVNMHIHSCERTFAFIVEKNASKPKFAPPLHSGAKRETTSFGVV